MPAKYYNDISSFLRDDDEKIVGRLSVEVTNHQLLLQQRISWLHQVIYLKQTISKLPNEWSILLEYPIPRRAKRIDIVVLAEDLIFIIEFKDKATQYSSDAVSQVEDYALDIRDFHRQSAKKTIIPIVWASDAKEKENDYFDHADFVKPTLYANANNLDVVIQKSFEYFKGNMASVISPSEWDHSEYLPTPTIIEAAQYLFAGQSLIEF